MLKRGLLLLLLLLFGMGWSIGNVGAQDLERVHLSEVVRSVFYSPQYVAIEKGFFEDEGIQIRLTTAWGADKGAAALISGSVDIGFFGPEAAIYIYQQGAMDYLVGFAQLTARDGSFFMSRYETKEEFSWENVKGKTIVGARRGGVPQMVLEYVLKKHAIEPFVDVEIITNLAFEAAVGAYESGLGDYIAQFEPAMSTVEMGGGGTIVSSLGEQAGPITYTLYHVRKGFFEEGRDILTSFTRAIYRGQLWVAEHNAKEVALVVAPFFPTIEHGILTRSIDNYQSIGAWPTTPVICEEGFIHLQEVMKEAGELMDLVPFNTLMHNSIAQEVIHEEK